MVPVWWLLLLILGEKREEQSSGRSQGAQGQFGSRVEREQQRETGKTESGATERMPAQRIGKSQPDPFETRGTVGFSTGRRIGKRYF